MDDLISRQAAIRSVIAYNLEDEGDMASLVMILQQLPSAQPEYFDYTDIDEAWEYYAKENDANLTDNAKQIKDAMWVGYRIGLKSAQPETMYYPQVDGVTPSVIVQPERKKGKWIKTYRNGFGNLIGYCNQCGRSASVDNFCPNCGAEMRGEEDDFCSRAERRTDETD